MKNQTENELIEVAAKIAAWGESHGMSRAQLVRNFADLGSEKSFRDISAGQLEGYNAENQLTKYRAVYATMEELANQGGEEQIASRISYNEIDLLLYFRDPRPDAKGNHKRDSELLRMCDMYNVPVATNIATAEVIIMALERGDLDWRELVNPKSSYNRK